MSDLRTALVSTLLVYTGIFVLSGCGDGVEDGDGGQDHSIVPLSRLDREVPPHGNEGTVAGQIFWKPIRERALRIQLKCQIQHCMVDDSAVADLVHEEFLSAIPGAEGVSEEYREKNLEVLRIPHGQSGPPRVYIHQLVSSIAGRYLRNLAVHARSPEFRDEALLVVPEKKLGGVPAGTAFGVASFELPSWERLEEVAARGVKLWIHIGGPETDIKFSQTSYPMEIGGAQGRALPIPVVFACHANRTHIHDALAGQATWKVDIRGVGTSVNPRSEIIVGRIRGVDSSRKVVVTTGRMGNTVYRSLGSNSLALATLLDVARVLASAGSRNPALRGHCDLEFVHVVGGTGQGFSFLEALNTPGQSILGVVNMEDVVSDNNESDRVYLSFDGRGFPTALGRAVHGVAHNHVGTPGAWRHVGVDDATSPIPDGVATACGHEVIPLVSVLGGVAPGARMSISPSSIYEDISARVTSFEPRHKYVGTPLDDIQAVADKKVSTAVQLGRIVAIALARIGGAWSPEGESP